MTENQNRVPEGFVDEPLSLARRLSMRVNGPAVRSVLFVVMMTVAGYVLAPGYFANPSIFANLITIFSMLAGFLVVAMTFASDQEVPEHSSYLYEGQEDFDADVHNLSFTFRLYLTFLIFAVGRDFFLERSTARLLVEMICFGLAMSGIVESFKLPSTLERLVRARRQSKVRKAALVAETARRETKAKS